jgi:deoxyribodipyrimidine photo-lyase
VPSSSLASGAVRLRRYLVEVEMTTKPDSLFFKPTRNAGLARLAAFAPAAGRSYANRRNTDYGPADRGNVSALSPYIRHRLITEREVLDNALQHHALGAAEKFVQEVFWRGYFKGHLETRPEIWRRYRANLDQQLAAVSDGGGLARAWRRAVEGKTGIDCFDAWAEELIETGYLHNHTRMWFASIWIFTLRLPWELGADFTYRHFIDGDPASNTLSWRWVGGLHTRGKTYLARPDNIFEHTNGRFRPKGLAPEAIPLDEPPLPGAQALRPAQDAAPSGPAILLLTEEDLHPESLALQDAEIRGVIACHAVRDRSPLDIADPVMDFTEGALADGLQRAKRCFATEGEIAEHLTEHSVGSVAKRLGAARVLTPYAPVGPVAERLAAIRPGLAARGIEIIEVRRPEDTAIWPRATKGFFALRERIPDLIAELGIGAPDVGQDDLFAAAGRASAHR